MMGWLRRTFGRQGIDVPEPLEVLAVCCLLRDAKRRVTGSFRSEHSVSGF